MVGAGKPSPGDYTRTLALLRAGVVKRSAASDGSLAALNGRQNRAFSDTKNWLGAPSSSVCAVPVVSDVTKPFESIVL